MSKKIIYECLKGLKPIPGIKLAIYIVGSQTGDVLYKGPLYNVPFGLCSEFVADVMLVTNEGFVEIVASHNQA